MRSTPRRSVAEGKPEGRRTLERADIEVSYAAAGRSFPRGNVASALHPICAKLGQILTVALLLLTPLQAAAQTEGQLPPEFTSDRPGFANTTQTAAVGHLTTELGIDAFLGDEMSGALPNARLRTGVLEWLELRLILPSAIGNFGTGGPNYGLGDMSVGFKAGSALHDTVDIATNWDFSLPTATTGFGAPEVQVTGEVILDWNFWGPLTLTSQAIFTIQAAEDPMMPDETVRSFVGAFSLRVTWQIIDEVGAFVQSYASAGENVDWGVHVGGGVYWLILPNWQIDAFFDSRVTENGDDPTLRVGTTLLW